MRSHNGNALLMFRIVLSKETEGRGTKSLLFADLRQQSARQVRPSGECPYPLDLVFACLDLLLILYVSLAGSLVQLAHLFNVFFILFYCTWIYLFILLFASYDTYNPG